MYLTLDGGYIKRRGKIKVNKMSLSVIGAISIALTGCSGAQVHKQKKPRVQGCHSYSNAAMKSGSILSNGVQVKLEAWGYDKTDKSQVGWNQQYPSPCFDDAPNRRGKPNAAWQGDFYLKENSICFSANKLFSKYPPTHTLAGGYTVTLGNGTFKDGTIKKVIPLFSFSRTPTKTDFVKCEAVIPAQTKAEK